jgi:beta-mannosidase
MMIRRHIWLVFKHISRHIFYQFIIVYLDIITVRTFVYMNHVLQGDAIKTAMEAHRRDKPYCWGSLFWQHNDCWPVASWASRDYYGRWKAQHYFARYFFDKYLLSAYNSEGRLRVYVVSDNQSNTKADLEVKVVTLTGKVVNSYRKSVVVPANTSTIMLDESTETILEGEKAENVVIVSSLKVGEKLYTNNNFLVKQGALNFPACNITTKVEKCDGGVAVSVSSDNFARAVYLSIEDNDNFFEDNYFNILPGTSRTIKVKTKLSAEAFEKQLKVEHLGNCK